MTDGRSAGRISARDLYARIQAGTAPAILDVRSRAEYRAGRVPGARHVPFWAVAFSRRRLPASPAEPMVVYCGLGPRAAAARAALGLMGFGQVVDLEGHWDGWVRNGLPIETD